MQGIGTYMKRIGILTSGGDCSGLNSVIRAAAIRASNLGCELIGIKRGVSGLLSSEPDFVVLSCESCDESMLSTSGSVLYSDVKSMRTKSGAINNDDEFKSRLIAGYKKLALDGLIYIGGDGSLHMLYELSLPDSLNIVAIPKTIDNDVSETDFSIGFFTAVEVVVDAVDNVRSTARSHERVMVIEVMGRGSGFIAMYAGVASGADVILVPEFVYDSENLKAAVEKCCDSKGYAVILVAESAQSDDFKHETRAVDGVFGFSELECKGIGKHISILLKDAGFESRSIVLGHVQRGGSTSITDRIIGSSMGTEAVNAICTGDGGCFLAYSNGGIKRIPVKDIGKNTGSKLCKSNICVRTAIDLGIYIGNTKN
jgi:6-phosphofructokinase 1